MTVVPGGRRAFLHDEFLVAICRRAVLRHFFGRIKPVRRLLGVIDRILVAVVLRGPGLVAGVALQLFHVLFNPDHRRLRLNRIRPLVLAGDFLQGRQFKIMTICGMDDDLVALSDHVAEGIAACRQEVAVFLGIGIGGLGRVEQGLVGDAPRFRHIKLPPEFLAVAQRQFPRELRWGAVAVGAFGFDRCQCGRANVAGAVHRSGRVTILAEHPGLNAFHVFQAVVRIVLHVLVHVSTVGFLRTALFVEGAAMVFVSVGHETLVGVANPPPTGMASRAGADLNAGKLRAVHFDFRVTGTLHRVHHQMTGFILGN